MQELICQRQTLPPAETREEIKMYKSMHFEKATTSSNFCWWELDIIPCSVK
jgi:hypothetical protein